MRRDSPGRPALSPTVFAPAGGVPVSPGRRSPGLPLTGGVPVYPRPAESRFTPAGGGWQGSPEGGVAAGKVLPGAEWRLARFHRPRN